MITRILQGNEGTSIARLAAHGVLPQNQQSAADRRQARVRRVVRPADYREGAPPAAKLEDRLRLVGDQAGTLGQLDRQ